MASRTVAKSAIPITNPNKLPEPNGKEEGSPESLSIDLESSPSNANHPSSTVGPISEAPRPTANRPPENTWVSLDMGGVNIKNLPATSGLFSFTFLSNLYLNHNALTSIPPQISRLRHLEVLDFSGNSLASVPPELGMCTRLKELYLFDNHIATLPPELGSLHQLQTLGVEGNPLDLALKQMVQKEGTPALISFLRDSCPVPAPPPERTWRFLISNAERDALAADPATEKFSVLCYNILCEKYATERLYGYTPSWALSWDYRKELILTEVMNHDADFLCLQEVDIAQYEDYFVANLVGQDYEGVYWPKSRYKTMSGADQRQVDGCATFFKKSKCVYLCPFSPTCLDPYYRYKLVEKQLIEFSALAMQRPDFKKNDDMFNRVLGKDNIAVVCLLESIETATRVIIANAHIHWDPAYRDVKLVQVALLIEEVEKIAHAFSKYPPRLPPNAPNGESTAANGDTKSFSRPIPTYSDGSKIPLIICGDFNSVPSSGVYEFLANGHVPANHADFMSHVYGKYTSDGLRHKLGLKSAYAGCGELPMTNYTPSFQGVIDYIWYGSANLAANAVLGEVDQPYLEKVVGFPNAHFPSEYILSASVLVVR
jgi:CCR4-NOT transcription complex subunit 6